MQVIAFNSDPSKAQLLSQYDIWTAIFKEENLKTPVDRNLASECVGQYLLARPDQFQHLLEVLFI